MYVCPYSESWLKHASNYVAIISQRLDLGKDSLCVELASNDDYLLQYFVGKGIPVIDVEPAANVGKAAEKKGVPGAVTTMTETEVKLWGVNYGHERRTKLIAPIPIGSDSGLC